MITNKVIKFNIFAQIFQSTLLCILIVTLLKPFMKAMILMSPIKLNVKAFFAAKP